MTITDYIDSIQNVEVQTKARDNYNSNPLSTDYSPASFEDAMIHAFDWIISPEGGAFWSNFVYGSNN